MTPMMRGAAISRYAEAAAQVGLDARAMLRRVDIDSRVLNEPELRIPAPKIFALLDASALASGCETFGLRLAVLRRLADYGPIALLLAHQPTMRDTLMTLVRYQRMLNEALLIGVEDHADDVVTVSEAFVAGAETPTRQASELAVATHFQVFSDPKGPRLRPRRVHFTHGPPADASLHRQVFGPIVEFNSEFNGFTCDRAEFDSVSASADPALVQFADGFISTLPHAQATSVADEVRKAIHVLLPFDGASIGAVAARLGVSKRTMQRRLADEDAEFSLLLNEIRREQSVRHLSNARLPLSHIAGLVGYSRQTSFARWFAGEFGMIPSAWRTAGRARPATGAL
jgi:AraC-like DNA-binding protein